MRGGIRWSLCALFSACLASAHAAAPTVPARAWLLVDHNSGQVLAEHNADQPLAPASLTKLMTALLAFEQLARGAAGAEEPVTVSARAAAAEGARMFLRVGETVTLAQLLQGALVRSANDAAVALAEHLAGAEATFVAQMNAKAAALGLSNTRFVNATGFDAEGHVSSARDLTHLARTLIAEYPSHYALFATKEFRFRDLKHYNRNALLWRDAAVDGVKTGHTRAAGYSLIASARRDGMRLIATVLGARDEEGRIAAAERLLGYAFDNFETRLLYAARAPAAQARVWMGADAEVALGTGRDLYLTLPRGWHERLRARLTVRELVQAPVRLGERLGTLALALGERELGEYPLVALAEVRPGNWLEQAADRLRLWLK